MTAHTFTAAEKRAEAQRELDMRLRHYPGMIESGKLSSDVAFKRTAIMRDIVRDYTAQMDGERLL